MILEKQTEAKVLSEGNIEESIGMSLDLDSAQILMQMLSKNLYSDAIGSTVRECASNALDSHRRAGVTETPIIVALKKNNEGAWEFSVEDFGIGLDADDVKNIISKYGKSTKRNSATELGMMGLGFKAPLAYSSSFYFVCRKDGVERKYMMYEGEDVNTIDLLHECSTEEKNGVKVIVPVTMRDVNSFKEKIQEQLAYFESVYFDCPDVDNDFVIQRSEHFQFSQLASDANLHLCLDNVYYPLDFNKLGISPIRFPVALRFSLTDGIFPTPNREAIRYTEEAKIAILDKIQKVADFYVTKFNESVTECTDLFQVFDYYKNDDNRVYQGLNVARLLPYATISFIKPSLKGIQYLDLEKLYKNAYYFFVDYKITHQLVNNRVSENKWNTEVRWTELRNNVYFKYSDRISALKKDYVKHLHNNWRRAFIIKKNVEMKLGKPYPSDYTTYYHAIGLKSYPKSEWRAVIQEYQKLKNQIIDGIKNVDTPPQSFIDGRKKQRVVKVGVSTTSIGRKVKLKGEIVGKRAEELERWVSGKNCKWVSTTYNLEKMESMKGLYLYGGESEIAQMDRFFKIRGKITLVQMSDRELKNMEKTSFHNWMKFSKFMEGNNKPFKRLVTAYMIYKLMAKYDDTFEKAHVIGRVSTALSNQLIELEKYKNEHYKEGKDELYESMLSVAKEYKLYDYSIYHVYVNVQKILMTYPFINVIADKLRIWSTEDTDGMLNVLTDMFKYHKHRINWEKYGMKLNVTEQSEELSEEDVESLVEE